MCLDHGKNYDLEVFVAQACLDFVSRRHAPLLTIVSAIHTTQSHANTYQGRRRPLKFLSYIDGREKREDCAVCGGVGCINFAEM